MSEEENQEENHSDKLDELESDDRINFTVYDMPMPLVQEYISMAKLEYDNQVWRVLEHAMELLKQERNQRVESLEDRVRNLEAKVGRLETEMQFSDQFNPQQDDEIPATFGDPSGENEVAQTIDRLKELEGD